MRFPEFLGNENTKELLSGIFDSGRIPHAILIDGPEGAGKRTLARILAAAAVCEPSGEAIKPCGKCRHCINAFKGTHPDILTYSGGTSSQSFKVETARKIRLSTIVPPNEAERKVYILENAHNMTEAAQNALLKVLEEPPRFILFIITCNGRSRILETLRSRAQSVTVGPVAEDDAATAVVHKRPGIPFEQALESVRISGGIIGAALSLLDADNGDSGFIHKFSSALLAHNIYDFLKLSGELEKDTALFQAFTTRLPLLLRDAAAVKSGLEPRMSGYPTEAKQIAKSSGLVEIYSGLELSKRSGLSFEGHANRTLHITWLFSDLWNIFHCD